MRSLASVQQKNVSFGYPSRRVRHRIPMAIQPRNVLKALSLEEKKDLRRLGKEINLVLSCLRGCIYFQVFLTTTLLMEEILHQLICSWYVVYPCLSHYFQGFIHPRWLFGIPSIINIDLASLPGVRREEGRCSALSILSPCLVSEKSRFLQPISS